MRKTIKIYKGIAVTFAAMPLLFFIINLRQNVMLKQNIKLYKQACHIYLFVIKWKKRDILGNSNIK